MSQPSELPGGVWETLFPRALTLVDEISTHGGVSDPFYTFGGGTVLMLRYQHRLSKDIDLFVADPQSLGFITPRLSDVADEMCKSQYVEAANYVKLQFDEGEIDFVASPNLLSAPDAFEEWNLFGRRVRVETAAEIVAKKMFHRGDKATARDLFDLTMVIEHERGALANAEPFMYRHMDAFVANLQAPSAGYIQQFKGIESIGYAPPFEHASNVAQSYFNDLKKQQALSAEAAESFVAAQSLTVSNVDVARGNYVGSILHSTSHHIVQHLGRDAVVVHEKHRLPINIEEYGQGTDSIHLRYHNGLAQSIGKTRSLGVER